MLVTDLNQIKISLLFMQQCFIDFKMYQMYKNINIELFNDNLFFLREWCVYEVGVLHLNFSSLIDEIYPPVKQIITF